MMNEKDPPFIRQIRAHHHFLDAATKSIETDPGVVAYPILLRARDENQVAGESGLPLNVGTIKSLLPKLQESIPPSVHVDLISDRSLVIRAAVHDV